MVSRLLLKLHVSTLSLDDNTRAGVFVRQVRASTRLQSICRNLLQDVKLSADEGGNLSRVAAVPVPAAAAGRLSVAPGLLWYTSVH